MEPLNDAIADYTLQLKKGEIQKAYRGIMAFMSGLKAYMENRYPEYSASALYFGYMDMTYFAFTPLELKNRKLKIAVVYLHEQNRFEIWLGGANRNVQAKYIDMLSRRNIGKYVLSKPLPGVDSIIEMRIDKQPDFDHAEELKKQIEKKSIRFISDISSFLVHSSDEKGSGSQD